MTQGEIRRKILDDMNPGQDYRFSDIWQRNAAPDARAIRLEHWRQALKVMIEDGSVELIREDGTESLVRRIERQNYFSDFRDHTLKRKIKELSEHPIILIICIVSAVTGIITFIAWISN